MDRKKKKKKGGGTKARWQRSKKIRDVGDLFSWVDENGAFFVSDEWLGKPTQNVIGGKLLIFDIKKAVESELLPDFLPFSIFVNLGEAVLRNG
jgi:hypothetical protein